MTGRKFMYGVWFERTLPKEFAPLLEGVAVPVGVASETPDHPFEGLSKAQAIIAGSRVAYDASLMDQAPGLRVIARTGIGLNNVVIADATARGIAVCNTPDAPTISTAEHAVGLMFNVAKRVKQSELELQRGDKVDFITSYQGLELYGRCLGLIGLGRIGGHVARLARGIGMQVIAFDPYISAERAAELGVELAASIEAVLDVADVVSLHVPLTPETRGLMNAGRFARMKQDAIFINAARGGLVDEAALLEALESGRLWGAGLDVFETEPPPPHHPLLGRADVVATPHIAGVTRAGKDRIWRGAIAQVLQVLRGERPDHLVNPEVWPPRGHIRAQFE
jgi:D-3-phosphoglycerate dehydrogenase